MAGKKPKRRSSFTPGEILLFVAGILFCLVLISTALLGGLFARYTTTSTDGDNARVAAFKVNVAGPENVTVKYGVNGDTGAYTLTIDNDSEVAVSYSVKVQIPAIDFGIKVKLGEKELQNTREGEAAFLTELDFGTLGSLAANTEGTYDLVFSVTDWAQFTQMTTTASRSETLSFTVHIDVVQID